MRPTADTPIGTAVVYDAPGQVLPVKGRPQFTFLGMVPDDDEPDEYAWVATRGADKPEVTSEIAADLLVVDATLPDHVPTDTEATS